MYAHLLCLRTYRSLCLNIDINKETRLSCFLNFKYTTLALLQKKLKRKPE